MADRTPTGPNSTDDLDGQDTLDPLDEDLPGFSAATTAGRYELREELGRGGMGVVYRAFDTTLNRDVALKVMTPAKAGNAERARRFHREAMAVAKLDHPSLTRLLDFGELGGRYFLTMEIVEGPTLQQVLNQRGPLPPDEALAIAIPIARALHHAHQRGIIHRDVSPKNVLIAEGDRPLLTDFGIALDVDAGETMTLTGQVLGTPAYMSPEQARGDRAAIGPATDIYALGAVLYRMLANQPPTFDRLGSGPSGAPAHGRPTPVESLVEGLPLGITRLCHSALAGQPEARYLTAEAMAEDMERERRGDGARGVTVDPVKRLRWWASRHRAALTAVTLLTVAALVATAALWMNRRAAEQSAETRRVGLEASLDQLEAEGAYDKSDALLEGFTELYEGQGLKAVPEAWLSHSKRKRARGDRDGEMAALVQAYASDTDAALNQRVLSGLVDALYRRERWASLYTAMKRMSTEEAFRPYRLAAALGAGDFPLATTLLSETPTAQPVISPLLRGTPTNYKAPLRHTPLAFGTGFKMDVDGNGETELVFSTSAGDLAVVALKPGLPLHFSLPLSQAPFWLPTGVLSQGGGAPDLLVVRDASHQTQLIELTPQGMVTHSRHDNAPLWDAVSTDLDGNGQLEWYGAAPLIARRLVELHPEGGQNMLSSPHPATDAAGSDVLHTLSADLDADGRQELVVAVGPWRAFDLRVFHRDPGASELSMVARTKLGHVASLAAPTTSSGEHLLVAVKTDAYASRLYFPPEAPAGMPPGLYTFQWTGRLLEPRSFLPASEAAVHDQLLPEIMHCGDLDDDGNDEVLGRDSWFRTHVYHHGGDGRWEHLILADVIPLAMHDIDADGQSEVIASVGGTIWVLGHGDTPLPNLADPDDTIAAAPPPKGEAGLRTEWESAEDLASLGLHAEAATLHERIAGLALSPGFRGAAQLRAAQLTERAGNKAQARRLFKAAIATKTVTEEALRGLARVAIDDHHFEEAAEARAELAALDVAQRPDAEHPVQPPTPTLEIDFERPLHPTWRINNPVSIRRHAAMLNVKTVSHQGIVARLPLIHTGQRLSIEIEGELRASDWGSRLMVGFLKGGEALAGVALHSLGGGQVIHHEPLFHTPRQPNRRRYSRPVAWLSVAGPEALRRTPAAFGYRLDLAHDHGIAEVIEADGQRWRWITMEWDEPIIDNGGALELFIGSDPHISRSAFSSAAEVGLRRIRLNGVKLAEDPSSPSPYLSLADGDPTTALDTLNTTPAEARSAAQWLALAIALDELGEGGSATASALDHMSRAQGFETIRDDLLALLRHHHARFGTRLADVLGPDFMALLYDAWAVSAQQHPDDPLVSEVLNRYRRHYSDMGDTYDERQALLLLAHAVASTHDGHTGAGLQSARKLDELHGLAAAVDHRILDEGVMTLSTLLAREGETEEAARWLQDHLSQCLAPEIFTDRLAIHPVLSGLAPQSDQPFSQERAKGG